MGRRVVMNHLSLDGVMQGPGRADEETRGGFTRGGWREISATPDDPAAEAMGARMAAGRGMAVREADLPGPAHRVEPRGGPFTNSLNATTTYVASSTLTEPVPWPGSTLLAGDVVAALRHVTAQTEGVLEIIGSGFLVRPGHTRGDRRLPRSDAMTWSRWSHVDLSRERAGSRASAGAFREHGGAG